MVGVSLKLCARTYIYIIHFYYLVKKTNSDIMPQIKNSTYLSLRLLLQKVSQK